MQRQRSRISSAQGPGVQWARGAVGNARWTGVRLRDIFAQAGVKTGAQHVQFQGADRPVVASVPLFTRSIPLAKALHPDTILAYGMNGRPLPLLHGAPLRVITPGWKADSCTKWLTEITVQAEEAKGYYMQTAYRVPMSLAGLAARSGAGGSDGGEVAYRRAARGGNVKSGPYDSRRGVGQRSQDRHCGSVDRRGKQLGTGSIGG